MVGFDKPSMRSGSFIMELTQELVKSLFDYHEDGYLIWKIKPAVSVNIGDRVGCLHNPKVRPRWVLQIYEKQYFVSRIIFLYHKGYMPLLVDHKDRDRLNNRIENLREATHSQNGKNVTKKAGCTSKYLGVVHHLHKYWHARIRIKGKFTYLGSFKTENEAAIAYNKAAKIHHGEFANLNVIQST